MQIIRPIVLLHPDSLNVFPQDVKFQINVIPCLQRGNIGMFVSVRDDGDRESVFVKIKCRQTDAIEAD